MDTELSWKHKKKMEVNRFQPQSHGIYVTHKWIIVPALTHLLMSGNNSVIALCLRTTVKILFLSYLSCTSTESILWYFSSQTGFHHLTLRVGTYDPLTLIMWASQRPQYQKKCIYYYIEWYSMFSCLSIVSISMNESHFNVTTFRL